MCEVDNFECPFIKALKAYKDPPLLLDKGFKIRKNFEPREPFSRYMKLLREGWVVSVEYEPWENKVINADAINVTDNPFGIPHSHSVYEAIRLKSQGYEVVAQLVCRNKGREALASEIIALSRGGVRNLLALTGDWREGSFFDLDSARLVYLARLMGEGLLWDGSETERVLIHVGVAVNPYIDADLEEKRLRRKLKAGAEFAQSQPVFNDEALRVLGRLSRFVPLQGGILITKSWKVIRMLEEKGVRVSDAYKRAIKKAKEGDWGEMANFVIRFAKSMRESLNGVHLMCPNAKDVCERLIAEVRNL